MSTASHGQKRAYEENLDGSTEPKIKIKRSKYGLTVPYAVFSAKEQECLALQAELAKLKQEWMRK